jgi:hypothetical protein
MSNENMNTKLDPTPTDESALEFAQDLSDLNFEFQSSAPGNKASESANTSADSEPPEEEAGPSIDDFQLVSGTQTTPVEQSKGWYAKVLGQQLGPFPFSQLVQMVLDQEIGCKAMLRHGAQGEWIRAGEIEGLFPEEEGPAATAASAPLVSADDADDDDFVLKNDDEFAVQMQELDEVLDSKPKAGKVAFQAFGGEINRVAGRRPTPNTQESAKQTDPDAEAAKAPAASAPNVPEKKTPAKSARPKMTKEEREEARRKEIANRLNAWLDDKVKTPDPPAEVEESEAESPAVAAAAPVAPAAYTPPAHSGYDSPGMGGASGYSPATAPATRPTFTPPKPQFKKSSSGGGNPLAGLGSLFKGISMPDSSGMNTKALLAVGAVALVFALMYIPSLVGGTNDMAIYKRLREIYTEIEMARSMDASKMSQLNAHIPEVKAIAEKLEKAGAGAAKPIKQNLFWAARNCLVPLLERPSTELSSWDERFENHMVTAGRLLGDSSVPPPPPPGTDYPEDESSDE